MSSIKFQIPPRFYYAQTVRVQSVNCVEMRLDLNFGVHVRKNIVLEGVDKAMIPKRLRDLAFKSLIFLLGGKASVIQVEDDRGTDGYVKGRVYLADQVHGEPEGLVTPAGLDTPMLEIGLFYQSLIPRDFDLSYMKSVLNGTAKVSE